jgi:hypothetical protein
LVTVDVRKRRPKHNVVESLHIHDIINVVTESEEGREEPFGVRTNKEGIDFLVDGSSERIRMRHQRCLCKLPLVPSSPSTVLSRAIQRKQLLGPGDDSSDDSSNDSSDDEDVGTAVLDREFDHLDRACKVHAMNLAGQTVDAKVVWASDPNGARIDEFGFDDVLRCMKHRLHQEEPQQH